jgi:curved DNA-binding protein CbpA
MTTGEGDYYTLLGVDRDASAAEIGRAYKRTARSTHPDMHPDEPSAAKRFTAVTVAYETLGDPARRRAYDRTHPATGPRYGTQSVRWSTVPTRTEPVRLGRKLLPAPNRPLLQAPSSGSLFVDAELLEIAAALRRLLLALRTGQSRSYR